jgi:hypothetical protein
MKPKKPSRYYYNSIITNLKFQFTSQNLLSIKSPRIKINRPIIIIIIITDGPKWLKLLYPITNLNTISSPW